MQLNENQQRNVDVTLEMHRSKYKQYTHAVVTLWPDGDVTVLGCESMEQAERVAKYDQSIGAAAGKTIEAEVVTLVTGCTPATDSPTERKGKENEMYRAVIHGWTKYLPGAGGGMKVKLAKLGPVETQHEAVSLASDWLNCFRSERYDVGDVEIENIDEPGEEE